MKGPHVAEAMITRTFDVVKAEQRALDGCRPRIEILAPVGARLARELEHRHVGAHVLCEPRLVHLQVVVRHAHANPASPGKIDATTHRAATRSE
jgi:hypothetical protein